MLGDKPKAQNVGKFVQVKDGPFESVKVKQILPGSERGPKIDGEIATQT